MDRLTVREEDVPSVNILRLANPSFIIEENENFLTGASGLGCDNMGRGNVRAEHWPSVPCTLNEMMQADIGNLQNRSVPTIFRDMCCETASNLPNSKQPDFKPLDFRPLAFRLAPRNNKQCRGVSIVSQGRSWQSRGQCGQSGGQVVNRYSDVKVEKRMNSQQKQLPLGRTNINVSIIQGDLTSEKCDVIVCTASKNLDLNRGRASRALLEKAGKAMQADCESNYPNGIEYDEVAMVSAGNLPCKRVYFVALPVWGTGSDEEKVLTQLITGCLKSAGKNMCQSIAFPALGTGLLKYPAEKVAGCTLKCVEDFSNNNQWTSLKYVHVVIYHKDTESFTAFVKEAKSRAAASNQGSASSAKKPTAVGVKSIISRQISNGDDTDSIGSIRVHIVSGEIAKFQADVIVNSGPRNLQFNSGGMAQALLEEAGEELQEDIYENYPVGVRFGDVAVTDGYRLKCNKIYHGALPEWDKNKTAVAKKPLCKFVCNCLTQAQKDDVHAIAFPTLGTGSLGYPAEASAQTMYECIKKYQNRFSDVSVKDISIVVYDKGDRSWKRVKAVFEQELKKVLETEDDEEETDNSAMYKLLEIAAKNSLERTIAPPRGTQDWFKHQYKTNPRSPGYWSVYSDKKTLKDWQLDSDDIKPKRIPVNQQTFDAIKQVAMATWQSQHVGQGRDARGLDNLNYSSIQIKKVERIENCELFEKYALKRQELFHKAAKCSAFTDLENTPGSSGKIMTTSNIPADSVLSRDIHPEINEHYMFHGTLESVVDTIMKQGLDCRLGGAGAMFGQGVYAAESSTKSDQYADPKSNRTNSEKKMFLIRMCLGRMYVENTARSFARAPCMNCQMDKCSCKDSSFFDSVVGDGGWNFREFVVYDRTQVYPEYLITYERV